MIPDLSDNYWNNLYLKNEFKWDLGAISSPLKTYIEQLNNKDLKILIPGAGNSYESEFLFSNGFKNVVVLDFAEGLFHSLFSMKYQYLYLQPVKVSPKNHTPLPYLYQEPIYSFLIWFWICILLGKKE